MRAFDDDHFTRHDAGLDHPVIAEPGIRGDFAVRGLAFRIDDVDRALALQFLHCLLRDADRVEFLQRREDHAHELACAQQPFGIGHLHAHLQRAAFRVHRRIDEIQLAAGLVFAAIGELQAERRQLGIAFAGIAFQLALQFQQFLLANREIDVNRIDRIQRRQQRGRRIDEAARLDQRLADYAVARRAYRRVFEIEFRRFNLGFRGVFIGRVGGFPRDCGIEILLADRLVGQQRPDAVEILL